MRTHFAQQMRYVTMDKLKYEAITVMEREGLSPYRSSTQKRPQIAAAFNAWLRDMNGAKQPGEMGVDAFLNKSYMTPLRAGALTSALAFGGFGATAGLITGAATTGGLVIPAAIAVYMGYRVGKRVAEGRGVRVALRSRAGCSAICLKPSSAWCWAIL